MTAGIPRPEHPRPQMIRAEWMNLNGTWEFEIDYGKSGKERKLFEAAGLAGKIIVPFCPESGLSGVGHKDFMPAVWYRREFTVSDKWLKNKVLIHFGAVDYLCDVWVNGKWAGHHAGGYVSFTFDITAHLNPGVNIITVSAEDNQRSGMQPTGKQSASFYSHGCVYTRTTGIWQTVWLESVPEKYIVGFKLISDIENCRVYIDVEVEGGADGSGIETVARFSGRTVGSEKSTVAWETAKLAVDLSEKHLWGPGEPNLYDLDIYLLENGKRSDAVKCYFGLRSVAISGDRLLLNGKTLFQKLVLDQGFYQDGIYTAPDDEALKNDVEIALGLGFNGARLHQKIFEQRYLYWADRLGFMVWEEHANWGFNHISADNIFNFLPEWLSAVKRDFNSPCIVGWCPFNETPANQNTDVIRTVYEMTKVCDPTRPVIDTSGYYHVVTDVFDIHDYDQSVESWTEKLKSMQTPGGKVYFRNSAPETYTGQPYFVSEYGGIWWNPSDTEGWGYGKRPASVEEFIDRYRGLTGLILATPAIAAFCYTQLYDVEQEVNGLYTYDRKPKFDTETIRTINSQKAAIEND